MSNPYFVATLSSNEVYRNRDRTRCVTDDLDSIEDRIQYVETNKSDVTHIHNNYAPIDHTHSGYAPVNHSHPEYASADDIRCTITNVSTANEDLNDYTTSGIYSFAVAAQPTNRPEGTSNGWLIVIPWTNNPATQTIKQIWLRHGTVGTNDHCTYVRTKVADYGWSSWARMVTDKDITLTKLNGDVTFSWTGNDVVAKFKALDPGMYTAYSRGGATNAPNANEGFRYICHKTGTDSTKYGWILAFGTSGSVYAGYLDNDTWKGWHSLVTATPDVLWSGKLYMTATQTVTPSKKLSECRTGWILLWSDYDPSSSTANDADFCTTMIPKFRPDRSVWDGKMFLCDIPRFYGANLADVSTEKRIMKPLYIHDTKIVGHAANNQDSRNDVVLRAVYEF